MFTSKSDRLALPTIETQTRIPNCGRHAVMTSPLLRNVFHQPGKVSVNQRHTDGWMSPLSPLHWRQHGTLRRPPTDRGMT